MLIPPILVHLALADRNLPHDLKAHPLILPPRVRRRGLKPDGLVDLARPLHDLPDHGAVEALPALLRCCGRDDDVEAVVARRGDDLVLDLFHGGRVLYQDALFCNGVSDSGSWGF